MSEEVDDVSGIEKVGTALSYGARDIANSILQNRLPPDNLKELVPKIAPRPIFFIHAGADDAGHLGPKYYRAANEPKQIWEAQGGHTDGIDRGAGGVRAARDRRSSTARCSNNRRRATAPAG